MKYLIREGIDWRCREVTEEEYCICAMHLDYEREELNSSDGISDNFTLWVFDDDMDKIEEDGIECMKDNTNDKYYFEHNDDKPTEVIKEVFEHYVEWHGFRKYVKVKDKKDFKEYYINLYD